MAPQPQILEKQTIFDGFLPNSLSRLKVVFHGLLTVISRSIHATHCYRTNWFKCVWGRKAWLGSFYPTRMNFKTTKYARVLLFRWKWSLVETPLLEWSLRSQGICYVCIYIYNSRVNCSLECGEQMLQRKCTKNVFKS